MGTSTRNRNFSTFLLVLAFFVTGLILSVAGVSDSPLKAYWDPAKGGYFFIQFGYYLSYPLIIYLLSRPWKESARWILIPGLVTLAAYWIFAPSPAADKSPLQVNLFAALFSFGIYASLALLFSVLRRSAPDPEAQQRDKKLLFILILMEIFASYGQIFLDLSTMLSPVIHDLQLYRIEQSLGFEPSILVGIFINWVPHLVAVLNIVYAFLPLGFAVIIALEYMNPCRYDLVKVLIFSSLLAWGAYLLYPVVGPKFFLGNGFPLLADTPWDYPFSQVVMNTPYPRNGMPSMHFGWALLFWLVSLDFKRPFWRGFFAVYLGLTFLATLGLGEHFFTDLVVAIPFVVANLALCMTRLTWRDPQRYWPLIGGAGLWLAWVLLLRFVPALFLVPGVLPLFYVITLWASIRLFRYMRTAPLDALEALALPESSHLTIKTPAVATVEGGKYAGALWTIALMFAVSGFAALSYEVIFSKRLTYIFGSMSMATYSILITYMGGMALGSWLGGSLAKRIKRPLVVYGLMELGIGVYILITPLLINLVRDAYIFIGTNGSPDSAYLTLVRVLLSSLVLLVPTILMGATLPVLVKQVNPWLQRTGATVSKLYSANVAGAAMGAILVGYVILPFFGISKSALLTVVLNLFVAVIAFKLFERLQQQRDKAHSIAADGPASARPVLEQPLSVPGPLGVDARYAAWVLAIVGTLSLGLETVYIQLLAVVIGTSTYAFSLMLFAFLAGLSIGAVIIRRLMAFAVPPRTLLLYALALLSLIPLAMLPYWNSIPANFADYATVSIPLNFSQREFVRAFYALVAMVPTTIIIGAIFPLAAEIYAGRNQDIAKRVGTGAMFNTLGNITGVVVTGFLLIPWLGSYRTIELFALITLVLVGIGIAIKRERSSVGVALALIPTVALLLGLPTQFNFNRLATGANVYFANSYFGKVVDSAENIDGGLTTVSLASFGKRKIQTLLSNGKFQGNDAKGGEMTAQMGFALASLLHTDARKHALVIGYGTGVTSNTLHLAGFKQLGIVELNRDIVDLADRHFQSVNDLVSRKKNVRLYITDGRNFLLLTNSRYDLISIELSSIWFAGTASLYSDEFYALVVAHLTEKGVLQQWLQLHHSTPKDILYVIGSVRSKFRFVWLYRIGQQGIIIASNSRSSAPSQKNWDVLVQQPQLSVRLKKLGSRSALLGDKILLKPAEVDAMLADQGVPATYWRSTDDNMILEYQTPKGNALNGARTVAENLKFIAKYHPVLKPSPVQP